ncbi:hypothetical protein Zm00014a_024844 [Zea mays]|uniref:Uncharacterized protein n=1 Tax=Zea mays TaxID=4577 RepID=A0A3L6DGI4_MAIZE|nr:hypothetical protein Zm00014a_024844 [Zea mays]
MSQQTEVQFVFHCILCIAFYNKISMGLVDSHALIVPAYFAEIGKETAEFLIEPEITLELMMAANYLDT